MKFKYLLSLACLLVFAVMACPVLAAVPDLPATLAVQYDTDAVTDTAIASPEVDQALTHASSTAVDTWLPQYLDDTYLSARETNRSEVTADASFRFGTG